LPGMRPHPLVCRPNLGRMRLLLDGIAAVGKLSPAGNSGVHHPLAPAPAFGLRGLAAGVWRAPDERGGRAPTFEFGSSLNYITGMKRLIAPWLALATFAAPADALAGAGNFTLVNRTGANIGSMQIRRVGTGAWQPLGGNPAVGSRVAVAFADPDCAFDIQARLADGKSVTFSGVNLCEVTVVTLNRGPGGDLWVDYD
jgi:hypothetical protein